MISLFRHRSLLRGASSVFFPGDGVDHADELGALSFAAPGAHGESFGQSIVEGWKFSWRNDEVRSGILVVIIAALFMIPFQTLLPVFARDLLQVGAQGQGLLLTSMGIGALCSSLLIATVGDRMPRGLLMVGGVALYGVLVMIFSASPWFSLVDGPHGGHRTLSCQLPCARANRDSNLFAA